MSSESTTAMPGTSTGTTTALKEGADEIMAKSWKARWFGIGPGDPDNDLPRSRLIYPFSRFGGMWIIITSVFLVYTGIVTAPLVAFYWTDDTCSISPTLFLDVFIDSFFLVDIFITFKVGIFVGGEYIDKSSVILIFCAARYFESRACAREPGGACSDRAAALGAGGARERAG